MTPINLESMTVGTILDNTFKIHFRNFFSMVAIVAPPMLPYFVIITLGSILFPVEPMNFSQNANIDFGNLIGLYCSLYLGLFYLMAFGRPISTGAITLAVNRIYLGQPVSVADCYRSALKRLPTLIWTSFLVSLMISVGLFFCILPGIFLAVSWMLVVPVIMLEGQDSAESRARAWYLVRDRRMEILLVVVTLYIITMMVSGSVGILNLFLPQTTIVKIGVGVAQFCLFVAVAPLQSIGAVLMYFNARIEKEGFDLDMLAGEVLGEDDDPAPHLESQNQDPFQPHKQE